MRFRWLEKNRGFSTLAWGTSLFKIGGEHFGRGVDKFSLEKPCSWAKKGWNRTCLGGGFKYLICSPLPEEMIQFWLIFFKWVETTNQLLNFCFMCFLFSGFVSVSSLQFLLKKHSLVWNSLVLRDFKRFVSQRKSYFNGEATFLGVQSPMAMISEFGRRLAKKTRPISHQGCAVEARPGRMAWGDGRKWLEING